MIPSRKERTPWREVDGRAVILQPQQGEVHELNAAGTFLWNAADGSTSIETIAAGLADAFDVSADSAALDARDFYSGLRDLGLIHFS